MYEMRTRGLNLLLKGIKIVSRRFKLKYENLGGEGWERGNVR